MMPPNVLGQENADATEFTTIEFVSMELASASDWYRQDGLRTFVERQLQERAKRWLEVNGYDPEIALFVNKYEGGSEDCQCSQCADVINPMRGGWESAAADSPYIMSFTVQPLLAAKYL